MGVSVYSQKTSYQSRSAPSNMVTFPVAFKAKHQKLPSDAVHWLDLLTHLGYAPPAPP